MNTLYIVASGAQQRAVRLPAAQLYIGPVFSNAITHARRFAKREQDVRILSPKYGLIHQGRMVEPYSLDFGQLDARGRDHLVALIRSELPREATLPLRVVVLASDDSVELLSAACVGKPFEKVPVRTPLKGLSVEQQCQWLQAATWAIECNAPLPSIENLFPTEQEQLKAAARAASLWWSGQLMRHSPPPEASLFANALAPELTRMWEEVSAKSRGEWPEDISFSFNDQETPESPIGAAFQAIGLEQREWSKREWAARPLKASMTFSMRNVTAQVNDETTPVFQS